MNQETIRRQGYVDAHCHVWEFALFNHFASLEKCSNLDDLVETLKSRLIAGWAVGVRFNQESLAEKIIPARAFLDRAFGSTPVVIIRTCLHLAAANTAAMQGLGFFAENGLFHEAKVFNLLKTLVARLNLEPGDILSRGLRELKKLGIVKVIDMGMDRHKRPFFEGLEQEVKVDFYTVEFGLLDEALGFKVFLDGGLGARTAALTEEYADDPGNYGLLNHSDAALLSLVEKVHRKGKPIAAHAIGDRAVDQFLRVVRQSRHPLDRLEHVQYAREEQLEALAALEIPVCIQPIFSREMSWAVRRLGPERMKTAYAWGLMRDKGIRLLAGSDAPVDHPDPREAAATVALLKGGHHLDFEEVLDLFAHANREFYPGN
ncbi:Amidohydrolase family protein [Neomoorella glycerini]|uniref:Amidohydrolase family protein n=1 Tax=Neomoorella glycerini TaxID=55779 RepID=A0A6I5ZMY8_9FIRM|nr:amidohydrolase family protein [Moorella glycerini]QGP91274.1 Amidohydrolase family protein [Moorella glycerini]